MKRKDRYVGITLKWRLFDIIPNGMSQQELAEILDCSTAMINMVKSGKRNPDVRWIEIIADKFNIPKWQLFVDPQDVIPKEYLELMEGYLALEPVRQRDFMDAIGNAKKLADERKDVQMTPKKITKVSRSGHDKLQASTKSLQR